MDDIDKLRRKFLALIATMSELEDDWDTYGGVPITKAALTAAAAFVHNLYWMTLLSNLFNIAPLSGGGLTFEFKKGKRGLLLTFAPSGWIDGYLLFIDDEKIGKPDAQFIEEDFEENQPAQTAAQHRNYFIGLIDWVSKG